MTFLVPDLPVTIRQMTSADLEEVISLDQLSFSLPWPKSSFQYEIEKNQFSRCWVAEVSHGQAKEHLVAIIVVWLIIDEVHIATLAVHPDYRRMRIGERLLAFTLIDAFHSGATRAFLEVRAGNLAAQALYRRFGFKEVGIRKKYYQDNNEDAVMMNLEKLDLSFLESLQ